MNFELDQIEDNAIVALDSNEIETVSGGTLCGLVTVGIVTTLLGGHKGGHGGSKGGCGSNKGGHKGGHKGGKKGGNKGCTPCC